MIDEANNKVPVTAFTNGLQSREFIFSIYKNDSKMMANMLFKATKYMNAEDAMIVRRGKSKKRERQDDPYLEKRRKSARTSILKDDKRLRPLPRRTVNFTPLYTLLDQVLMQIRDDTTLTWLDKLKGDPNKRPENKYCRFHQNHGHDTF